MVLTVTHTNNLKIYNLSSGKTISEFLQKYKKNRKTMKADVDWETRVDFIQGFEFSTASTKVEISNDGEYIVAAGTYGPQLKIYDTQEMSLKCLRGCDSEIIDFVLLEDDYKKIAMVCADRNIELHARNGKYFKTRVPKTPRCLLFEKFRSDLIVGCSSNELYRLNLSEGKFMSSYQVNAKGISSVLYNPQLELLLAGGDEGKITFIDNRLQKGILNATLNDGETITTLQQSPNPFEFWVGSIEGLVRIYDVRTDKHIDEKRHPYMLPIKSIEFIPKTDFVVSTDSKSVRIYNKNRMEETIGVFEQRQTINNLKVYKDSGLFIYSNDTAKIGALFIPSIGNAPKFCQFLDNITEEFEERVNQNIFEDKRFVTREELIKMNAQHLIGSNKLQTHLNGFLMSEKVFDSLTEVT